MTTIARSSWPNPTRPKWQRRARGPEPLPRKRPLPDAAEQTFRLADIRRRLLEVIGHKKWRDVAHETRSHHESIRRYCTEGGFKADWLTEFAATYGVNGHWLLTGEGPVYEDELLEHAVVTAAPMELYRAFESRLRALETEVTTLRNRSAVQPPSKSAGPVVRLQAGGAK